MEKTSQSSKISCQFLEGIRLDRQDVRSLAKVYNALVINLFGKTHISNSYEDKT